MTDLLQAVEDAIFAALNVTSVTTLAPVFTTVPPNQQPPYIEIGGHDASEYPGAKIPGLEQHSVEIEYHHRGRSRRPLLAMMAAARTAIEGGALSAPGAVLEQPRWTGTATDREDNGTDWHGIHNFALLAQLA